MGEPEGPRPLNRRDLLAGAGTGILALYLVGCDGASSKRAATSGGTLPVSTDGGDSTAGIGAPGPPAGGGTAGGKLVVVWQAVGDSNDPAIGRTGTGWDSICNLTFAPLYGYSESNDLQPQCAWDLPHISRDGLTYTIPLRDGVTFHNDRPVVADDYLYAWDRVLDPANQSWAAPYLYAIQGAKERYEGTAETVTGLTAVNPRTIEITLLQPDVTFLYALTQPFMAPVPKEEVEKYGKDFPAHVVGNGPYKLTSYDPRGHTMLFDRHTGYHWPGLPYINQVEYRWGVDPRVQLVDLSKARADVLADGLDASSVATIRRDPKLKNRIAQQSLLAQRWVSLDQSRQPLFRDKRVRQALNWATDRDALSRFAGGTALPFGAPFPKVLPGFPRTFQPYTYNPAKARALLAEAGVARPAFELWLASDSPEEMGLGHLLQQQWAAVGITANVRAEATAEALHQLAIDNRCDAWFSRYDAIYPTMIDLISQCYATGGPSNVTAFTNAQIDELTAKARLKVDQVARDTLLAQVEQILGDDAVHVFLQTVNRVMGVDLKRVRNFHYSSIHGAYYDRMWLA